MSEIGFYENAELVLALVAPVGTDFDRFVDHLTVCLRPYRYEARPVHMSELSTFFREEGAIEERVAGSAEYRRLMRRMDACNAARQRGGADVLALAAAAAIHTKRPRNVRGSAAPLPRHAHVLRSL